MTEKRFKNVEEKLDWGTVQYFTYNDEKITDDEIENLVNQLLEQNEQLKKENQRMTNKLNEIALELVDNVISQGKATEISEMNYTDFLDYRAKNGKPMELQL